MAATKERPDVSVVRSDDVRALALLANALGWRVNPGVRGVSFSHETGDHFNLPDNDGLRQSVFVSKIKHLCRYATTRPADGWDLADEIADAVKLRRSQRRQFVKAVVDELGGKEKKEEEEKPMPAAPAPQRTEPVKEKRHIVSEGPYQRVKYTNPAKGIVVHEDSTAVIQRDWSDDSVDYACRHCDKTSDSPRSIATHQQAHTKDVEQSPAPPVETVVEATIEPDEVTAEQVLEQIAELVDRGRASQLRADNERLVADNERLRAEMAEVRQRADRLEGNLLVLRELMSEIGKEADDAD